MSAEIPNPNQEPQDEFSRMVDKLELSPEAKILNTPTPVDIAATDERRTNPEGSLEQRLETQARLDGVVATISETDDGTPARDGSRGMDVLNALTNMAVHEIERREDEARGRKHFPSTSRYPERPSGLQAVNIVKAFPNPGDLIAAYAGKQKGKLEAAPADEIDVEAVDKLLAVVYGERYDVYKTTLESGIKEVAEELGSKLGEEPQEDEFDRITGEVGLSPGAESLGTLTPQETSPEAMDQARQSLIALVDELAPSEEERAAIEKVYYSPNGLSSYDEMEVIQGGKGKLVLDELYELSSVEQTRQQERRYGLPERPAGLIAIPRYVRPDQRQMEAMTDAYPNPGDLVKAFGDSLDKDKEHLTDEGMPDGRDYPADLQVMDRILDIVYGERYEAYKSLLERDSEQGDAVPAEEAAEQENIGAEQVSEGTIRQLGRRVLRGVGSMKRNRATDVEEGIGSVTRVFNKRRWGRRKGRKV